MEFDDIERILALVKQHDLAEFELERDGLKLRIRKSGPVPGTADILPAPPAAPSHHAPLPGPSAAPGPLPQAAEVEAELELAVVKSPIVGTFYRSPEPGAKSFVELGEPIKKGQVLCIIEAMKLMNEITADTEGELVKAYVENGQAVQYGERLFAIKPA